MLDGLFASALASSKRREESVSQRDLENFVSSMTPALDVYAHLAKGSTIKLIAEIKRASPSRGKLAEIPSAYLQSQLYQESGAHAISVLTEETGFAGSLTDLEEAARGSKVPMLRKDFISNEYQILEARKAGAAFVLLILAWLKPYDFVRLHRFAHEVGLGVLVETHTEDEIEIANESSAHLIGINTRNLETFKTDIALFEKMASKLAPEAIAVAESSVKDINDVRRYREAGADVVLVGEALVTGDPRKLIPEFISVA
ncbi:MAG: hypothetical protein RL068_1143 [Actinomycetota bacterium]